MGTVSVVVAGGSAADIGWVCPTIRIGRIGSAFERLIQGGVIPLHTGINVRHQDAFPLDAKGCPEVIRTGIADTPIQGIRGGDGHIRSFQAERFN